ncbi:hypothetical protein P775_17865 [Puniceibacterium antarcticum]|uniref:TonB-denpendent receptor n=1 Tax=Puniceibacterium antarcticum TaxID=1206336 RepID=A0A2G8RAG9_9RHOB|nr:TonB-dependent receptor [Puniceibacterium antarcticum]PIL18441.1 hypothetical protein P775_17865 [Puniceibacterium antarcticum]
MSHLLRGASLFALAAFPASIAPAQTFDLDQITVYANQSDLPVSRTGTTVDVVDQDALDTAPQTRLSDYLSTLPGISVTSNGGLGTTTTLRMRGLPGYYVPVLINGIDVSDPSGPQTSFDWSNLVMGDISRVEVVKGSQSALYGSDAIGGIVAITTALAPDEPGTETTLRVEAGSNKTRRSNLSVGTATERAGLAFSIARATSDGFSSREGDGFTEADGYTGTQLSFDSYLDLTDSLRVGVTAYALDAKADYDTGPYGVVPESGLNETETRAIRAYSELDAGGITHSFDVTRYRITRDLSADGTTTRYDGERDSLTYKGTTTIDSTTLSFGADWTREGKNDADDRRVTGVFSEVLFAPRGDLDLSLSLRHDEDSDFGGHNSLRAALAWRPITDLTLRAVLSNGFRAPSLYELYDPTYGNPGMDAETSRNAELGVEKLFGYGASAQATLFYTEIDNLIDYNFTTNRYSQVPGTTVSKGLELSGRLPLTDRATLIGAFTYTDSRDRNDDPSARVPRYDLSLGVDARLTDKLRGMLNVKRIADVPDDYGPTSMDPDVPVKDYTLLSASVDYAVTDKVSAYLRIENLTDEQYQVIPGYQTSDRAAYFGVVATF